METIWATKEDETMKAAIYCRVSTEDQEREGTSLQTQLEACRDYCQGKCYEVAYNFSEAFSGLALERSKLNELRELIRNKQIDVVVVYCLDRLSRNATHGVILRDELDKYHVIIESVTEDIDKTPLGEAITYLRGTFSQIEAEKIRERTMRGKRARTREGRMAGGFHRTYGYDYIKVSHNNGGRRVINENEAKWVRQIYEWLVNEGKSASAITHRLRTLNAPTKSSQYWNRTSVIAILKNPAYTGKTYAFTTLKGKRRGRPKDEWIEIPDVTPPIVSQEMFDAAQRQLQVNRIKAKRNMKRQYLLRGHLYCRRCGRAYWGYVDRINQRYRCPGTQRIVTPVNGCHNKSWSADSLEALVWAQIECVLNKPELIITEIEKQRQDANQVGVLEAELQQVERQLKILDRDQEQLLQWALKGFPEETVVSENKRINERRTTLQAQKAELETQIKVSQEAVISLPKLESFIEFMQDKISALDFEGKRQAFDMLNIKIWLDGYNVEVTGVLPVPDDVIVTTHS